MGFKLLPKLSEADLIIYSLYRFWASYHLCVQNHGGNIVNISATLGYKGQALQVHAGSAKAANGKSSFLLWLCNDIEMRM